MLGPWNLGDGHGGNKIGVKAIGQISQTGHDTLVVNHYGIHGPSEKGKLLGYGMGGRRDAMTHKDLVTGATYAHKINSCGGTGSLGLIFQFAGHLNDHVREDRVVAMERNVDRIGLQYAQVRLADGGGGSAKKDVRKIRAHMAGSIICQGTFNAPQKQVNGISIHAVTCAMHDLGD